MGAVSTVKLLAPLAGVTEVTVGGVVSIVAKDQVKGLARGFPEKSSASTVAVYVWLSDRSALGLNVAVLDGES